MREELIPISKAQEVAIEAELRKFHLLGTGKTSIHELSKQAKDAFYRDYGMISIVIRQVNGSIE